MSQWTKKDRFNAILSGERADRPMVIGWRHFTEYEKHALQLAEANVAFTKELDWDLVKFTPRATYYGEVWGNQYDYQDYQAVLPRQVHSVIKTPEDLWNISSQKATSAAPFGEQIEAIQYIRQALPETPLVQTVFSPLTILLFLAGQMPYVNSQVYGSESPVSLQALFTENRAGVHHALRAISVTMADYVTELRRAGADGTFYAVMGTAHPNLFDEAAFNEFSRPYDSVVLEAAQQGKIILHTCGAYSQPHRFNDYRIDGISWDTEAVGNPGLDADLKATKVGGVDHTLFATNKLELIREQATKALRLMENQPFVLAPNCSIPNNVSTEALKELRYSVQ